MNRTCIINLRFNCQIFELRCDEACVRKICFWENFTFYDFGRQEKMVLIMQHKAVILAISDRML